MNQISTSKARVFRSVQLIKSAARLLNPDGMLIISTGNPETAAWAERWQNRFWYCAYQEHLTFPSIDGLAGMASASGLTLQSAQTIKYEHLTRRRRLQYAAQQWSYGTAPGLHLAAMAVAKRFRFGTHWDDYVHSHASGVYNDHYVAVLKSGPASGLTDAGQPLAEQGNREAEA